MTELLSPAGTLKNMRYALAYGADAVYAGQPRYSLRVRNNEFNHLDVMAGAIAEAHAQNKQFYIASNISPHNDKIRSYLRDMEEVIEMQPDALIMSDPGLIMMVREKWPEMPIHLSVQANATNYATVKFWHTQGIVRTILSRELGLDEIEGVYISQVSEDSGAEEAGLQEGDIIKQVDNILVRKFSELTGYLSSKRPGDTVDVVVDRDGSRLTKKVTLKKQQTIILPTTGFMVKNLSDEDKKTFGVKKGVKIIDVPEGYGRYDLKNKVIIAVDDNDITNIDDAREHFGEISRYGRTSFTMINEKGEKERLILQ